MNNTKSLRAIYGEMIYEVVNIDYSNKIATLQDMIDEARLIDVSFNEIKFLEASEYKDKHGQAIYEGDVVELRTKRNKVIGSFIVTKKSDAENEFYLTGSKDIPLAQAISTYSITVVSNIKDTTYKVNDAKFEKYLHECCIQNKYLYCKRICTIYAYLMLKYENDKNIEIYATKDHYNNDELYFYYNGHPAYEDKWDNELPTITIHVVEDLVDHDLKINTKIEFKNNNEKHISYGLKLTTEIINDIRRYIRIADGLL